MIRSWEEHQLNMDFSMIGVPCCDIDMVHITRNGRLIIGEIKNRKGIFHEGQKKLLARIVDAHKLGGTVLFITHDNDVHKGDDVVDVSKCLVEEYYWGGEWIIPSEFLTVKDAIRKLEEM